MKKVFVVRGYTGEYLDAVEWVAKVFQTRADAQIFCSMMNVRAREFTKQDIDEEQLIKELQKFDPQLAYFDKVLSYSYTDVELEEQSVMINSDYFPIKIRMTDTGTVFTINHDEVPIGKPFVVLKTGVDFKPRYELNQNEYYTLSPLVQKEYDTAISYLNMEDARDWTMGRKKLVDLGWTVEERKEGHRIFSTLIKPSPIPDFFVKK